MQLHEQLRETDPRLDNRACARTIANWIAAGAVVNFDVDNVLLNGTLVEGEEWTNPSIPRVIAGLEQSGVIVSLSTARRRTVVDTLKEMAHRDGVELELSGTHTVERGSAILFGNNTFFELSHPRYKRFFKDMKSAVESDGRFRRSWQDVQSDASNGKDSFCWGSAKWQGKWSGSLWYPLSRARTLRKEFTTAMENGALRYGARMEAAVNQQPAHDLEWISLREVGLDKAIWTAVTDKPQIFIADGPGDVGLAKYIKDHRLGMVIAVLGSPDQSSDIPHFHKEADYMVRNAGELVNVLRQAGSLVQKPI